MNILNGALFDNYVSDVAVTMVVGLGYYLYNSLKKKKTSWKDQNSEIKQIKSDLEIALERYQNAKTVEDYNDLIKRDYEKSEDPFVILNGMMNRDIIPNIETYNALLLNSMQKGNSESARLLSEEMMDITGPVSPNNYSLNIFIKGIHLNYIKNLEKKNEAKTKLQEKFDEEVRYTITRMEERGIQLDIISVNTIIDSLIDQNRMEKTWAAYNSYKKIIKPDSYTYTSLLKGFTKIEIDAEWLNRAFLVLEESKIGYNLEENFFNSLLDSCIKYNRIDKAVEIFNEMKEKTKNNLSEYAYSMMIKVYGKSYNLNKCLEMLKEIKKKGNKPSSLTYVCLMNICLKCRKVEMAEKLFEEMGNECDKDIFNTVFFNLINGYKNNKCFDKAKNLFEKYCSLEKNQEDISVYNAILDCCVQFNKFEFMEKVFSNLKEKKFSLDIMTYSLLLKGYTKWNNNEETINIYKAIKSKGLQLDEVVYNNLLDYFVRLNEQQHANSVYEDMKLRGFEIGTITYTVLLKLYNIMGNSMKAYELFEDMKKKEIPLTENIYQIIIDVHMKGNFFNKVITLFNNMLLQKIVPSNTLFESIINFCKAKGKDIEGLEILMSALSNKVKIDNSTIDNLIDNIIKSNNLQIGEKIEILSKFSMVLKELSLMISCVTYDKMSKFLFQNKTLNKLSSFNESSIYSTLPVANTITPSYSSNRSCYENEPTNNSNETYDYRGSGYDNFSLSRNPFMKKQGNMNNYPSKHNNTGNQFQHNNKYSNNKYFNDDLGQFGDNSHRVNSNYNNNTNYNSNNSNSLYTKTKSLYSSSGKDDLFGTSSSFKKGYFQK